MKKFNDVWVLIAGIMLFLISYKSDEHVNLLFKNLRFMPLDIVFGIITNFGVVVLLMLIVPIIVLYTRENQRFSVPRNFYKISREKNKKPAYLLLLSFIISVILSFIIKLIVLRQRPNELLTYPFFNIIDYSFPSMHAAVVFSLLPILTKYLSKQKLFWIAFSFLVAFTRIYFGFHFLSDVVFGGFFGYFVGSYLLGLYEKGKLWK